MSFATAFVSFVVSAVLTMGVLVFARRRNLYDACGGRKIHKVATPRIGGIAIFAGFLAGLALALSCAVSGDPRFAITGHAARWTALALGAFVMFFLGLMDDLRSIPARYKLIVQILVATAVVSEQWRFVGFSHFPDLLSSMPVWVSSLITVGWIVGLANAINLIDGVDGLAGGIAVIAAGTFAAMQALAGNMFPSLAGYAVAGAALGFLVHNFPFSGRGARIFMGDGGSLFLGYALAVLPLMHPDAESAPKSTLIPGLFACVAVLSIPIIDTLNAIRRRHKAHVAFIVPDRRHIHHILLELGFSVRQVLAIAWGTTCILAASALFAFKVSRRAGAILMVAEIAILLALWALAYKVHRARTTIREAASISEASDQSFRRVAQADQESVRAP